MRASIWASNSFCCLFVSSFFSSATYVTVSLRRFWSCLEGKLNGGSARSRRDASCRRKGKATPSHNCCHVIFWQRSIRDALESGSYLSTESSASRTIPHRHHSQLAPICAPFRVDRANDWWQWHSNRPHLIQLHSEYISFT
jgi:hypothetical protein